MVCTWNKMQAAPWLQPTEPGQDAGTEAYPTGTFHAGVDVTMLSDYL